MQTQGRYTRVAIILHWVVAALALGQFALGWWMQEIPKQPPGARVEVFNLHKSVGLLIVAFMLARIAWRLGHPAPAHVQMALWQLRLARATHLAFYALLVALPLTGYLGSAFSGYPVKFFGVTLPAWAGKSVQVKEWMSAAHLWLGWALALAFILHMAGVVKHTLVDRDGLLRRMTWINAAPGGSRRRS